MILIFTDRGYQPVKKMPRSAVAGTSNSDSNAGTKVKNAIHEIIIGNFFIERYTLELELGHIVMFAELQNWWCPVSNKFDYMDRGMGREGEVPNVTCSPYFLHLCV